MTCFSNIGKSSFPKAAEQKPNNPVPKAAEQKPNNPVPKAAEQKPNNPVPQVIVENKIEDHTRYSGKYEVFPEAKMFKYRLKASNGEILVVSSGYSSRSGAKAGIETFKKTVQANNFKVVTDKNDYSQFRLYTSNGARLVANGEFFDSVNGAMSAMESVIKFANTDKYIDLDEIPLDEVREEIVNLKPIEKSQAGKIEVFLEDQQWKAALRASNGQVLFVTGGYSSRNGLLQGIAAIQREVNLDNFRVSRDKQNRYQFKLYSSNNQQLVVGETYSNKSDVFSAVDSVRRFTADAKIIDL